MLDRKKLEAEGISGKYADLALALDAAHREALARFGDSEDGGTCNFDAPALYLPRWTEEKVQQAAAAAGVGCFKWTGWGAVKYVFCPRCGGQGNRRTRVAEAMHAALKRAGYNGTVYYQMD